MRCHVRSSRTITDPGVASANASPDATKVPEQASFTITTIAHRSSANDAQPVGADGHRGSSE
jgi:hypothetical protein